MWNRFKTFDPWLYLISIILITISVIVIYTLTVDSVGSSLYLRQGIYGFIGLVLMLLLAFVDYRSFKGWAIWIYGAGILSLVAVKLFGKNDFGAQRWIDIGFFQLQPSEVMKVILVIAVAAILTKSTTYLSARRFFFLGAAILLPVVAVMAQPDLGTAIVIAVSGLLMVWHGRLYRWQRMFIVSLIAAVICVFALSFHGVYPFTEVLKDYQKDRLVSFIDPARDHSGSGYNIIQSVIAVGSGGLTGKGLGFGSQSQLNFLPVAHADFIFAGIAEAWGLFGTSSIILLYAILMYRIVQAARIAKDDFGMYVCIGLMGKLLVEVLVNVGMNIGIMPVTGIPLPFLSYGGTTLLTNAIVIGIVQSIVIRYKRLTF